MKGNLLAAASMQKEEKRLTPALDDSFRGISLVEEHHGCNLIHFHMWCRVEQ